MRRLHRRRIVAYASRNGHLFLDFGGGLEAWHFTGYLGVPTKLNPRRIKAIHWYRG